MVLVLAPEGATYRVREGVDRVAGKPLHVAFIAMGEREIGLQVLEPATKSYFDQRLVCRHNQIRLIEPAHIGRVSEIPQTYLAQEDLLPLLFLRDDMSEAFLHLRKAMASQLTKEIN